MITDIASWVLLLLGAASVLIGGIGVLRLPEFYTRMHAASLTDTAASILILGGLMLQSGLTLASFKLLAILAFLLLTGPTATYALANAALVSGLRPNVSVPKTPSVPDDDETGERRT
ncbi:MAG: monovalent cation/H(+) antiporter subunit G [Gammaproteobacteria bacterium]|nr:monovalent cation/H(+) antiporter subunit G [Gammaproteobacteria bacterium]